MIVVVADDFTGASEIAGVAFRHGLRAVLTTHAGDVPSADAWIISADTRALPVTHAVAEANKLAARLAELPASFVFCKIDSVLRGHPAEELWAYRGALPHNKVLLVPANPANNRIIDDGVYYVDGVPIGDSPFATGHAVHAGSHVLDMLPAWAGAQTQVLSVADEMMEHKPIIVGNVTSEADLAKWAARLDQDTLAAGGAGFFSAILSLKGFTPSGGMPAGYAGRVLMVCGSYHPDSRRAVKAAGRAGVPVSYIPEQLLEAQYMSDFQFKSWVEATAAQLIDVGRAVLAVEMDYTEGRTGHIRDVISEAVAAILQRVRIDELCIEGGDTASAVLNRLGCDTFYPSGEWQTGVVAMEAKGVPFRLTVKPGSYRWPEAIGSVL